MSALTLSSRTVPLNDHYEVIVVGGGPAGCAAATAAAREGKRALLLGATSTLGGMGTLGLVPFFCGFSDGEKIVSQGLAERILIGCRDGTPHLKAAMSENPLACPTIDPELLKRLYDEMISEVGVTVLFGSQLCGVEMADNQRVDALLISNKSGMTAYRAPQYIDCTGDGDLAAWAGAEFEKGVAENGKTQAGFELRQGDMQPATLCFTVSNVDEAAMAEGPGMGFNDPKSPVQQACASSDYSLIEDLHSCVVKTGPSTYGFNFGHLFDVDCTDPISMSENMLKGRQQVAQLMAAFSRWHPAFKDAMLVASGSMLGVRESRRIRGDYWATLEDYRARRSFADEICRCPSGADIHSQKNEATAVAKLSIREVQAFIESVMEPLGKGNSFGLPYRCLTPKGLTNVLVAGRCISTDRRTNGSVRIMACCLNTGEAAGIAAALATDGDGDIHAVDTQRLRLRLRDHGGYLP